MNPWSLILRRCFKKDKESVAQDVRIHKMSIRAFNTWFVAVVVCAACGWGGYTLYEQYVTYTAAMHADQMRAAQVEENRTRVTQALEAVGITPLQADNGFWYTYTDPLGDQSVYYFDPYLWSQQQELTADQLAELANMVASSSIADPSVMHAVPEDQLPPDLQFNDMLYNNPNATAGTFNNTQSALETTYSNGTATADQLWELSYMYEMQGEYAKRDAVNAVSCKLYKARCAGEIPVVLTGTVVDMAGRPVENASVTVLSHPELPATMTNSKGTYVIKLSVLPMEKIRVSAIKRNFTNGVASTIVLGAGRAEYQLDTIVLTSPIIIVTIDTAAHTVTDPKDTANPDGSFVLHATSSTYEIPAGAIVHASGAPYSGPVDVYLYEFTRDTVPASLITLDTFNSVIGYAGNLMQTLGMPYIQFFAPSGEELAVLKSHPMLLTYKIPGMQDMLDNFYKRPDGPLTDAQLQVILDASTRYAGFPITAQFLSQSQISTFPAFWVLDHEKGVWENQGMRLLDIQGTMQAPFYTIDDTH